jgi:hypothetical protein
MSQVHDKILDVKAYVEWVRSNPELGNHSSYFDAYIHRFEGKTLKSQNQKSLGDYPGFKNADE